MEGRKEWKREERKGKRKRPLLVLVRQIYKIEHDKDYARTYKMYIYL